jgi:hypothetical protein
MPGCPRRPLKHFRAERSGGMPVQWLQQPKRLSLQGEPTMIATFLIVLSVLAVAVIGRAALDPQH